VDAVHGGFLENEGFGVGGELQCAENKKCCEEVKRSSTDKRIHYSISPNDLIGKRRPSLMRSRGARTTNRRTAVAARPSIVRGNL
jgi:hypothetical protein